ncbi:MAG: amidoligase family protein [Anaeroplasmataceae bacterium]
MEKMKNGILDIKEGQLIIVKGTLLAVKSIEYRLSYERTLLMQNIYYAPLIANAFDTFKNNEYYSNSTDLVSLYYDIENNARIFTSDRFNIHVDIVKNLSVSVSNERNCRYGYNDIEQCDTVESYIEKFINKSNMHEFMFLDIGIFNDTKEYRFLNGICVGDNHYCVFNDNFCNSYMISLMPDDKKSYIVETDNSYLIRYYDEQDPTGEYINPNMMITKSTRKSSHEAFKYSNKKFDLRGNIKYISTQELKCFIDEKINDGHIALIKSGYIAKSVKNFLETEFKEYNFCQHCGSMFLNENMCHEIHDNNDIYTACISCSAEYSYQCDDCGERHISENMNSFNNNISICNGCYNKRRIKGEIHECDDCGSEVLATNKNINPVCNECGSLLFGSGIFSYELSSLHQSSYTPDMLNFSKINDENDDLYMGIELEVEPNSRKKDEDDRDYIVNDLHDNHPFIYCKEDGSVRCGMEIVTHPCTIEYHKKHFMPILDLLKSNNYISHDVYGGASFHIHVNRTYFGDTTASQELGASKIIVFIEKFWDDIYKLSRRTKRQLRWCKRPTEIVDSCKLIATNESTIKEGFKEFEYANKGTRYVSLNITEHTFEFRIWRGTLKTSTAIATMELTKEICRIAKNLSIEKIVNAKKITDLLELTNTVELQNYLELHGIM